MTADAIRDTLRAAAARGIHFHIEGEVLRSRAPKGAIDAALAAFVGANKRAIVAYLATIAPRPPRSQLAPRLRNPAGDPLSLAQERFWFIDRLTGDGAQYNMPIALRIRGDFDAAIAEQALQRIVERHAPLHSVYVDDAAEGLLSRPREDRRFVLEQVDFSRYSAEERDALVRERMLANAHTPFNLAQDLMLRGTCIRLGTDECVLLLCVPHIAADGWSFLVMEKEFVAGYEAIAQGKPDPLAPLALRYGDYAAWQRERLREAVGERQLAYWERQLRDLPAVHGLVLDRPRAEGLRHRAGWHEFAVAPALYADLKQLALEQGCTLFMVLHAVFALLLSRHAGQADVVVGTPVLNRLERDLEALIGCFVNTLVLRVDCDPTLTFAALLQQVKTVNLDAQANQEVTFDQVVERLRPVRSLLHAPLFQIMFSMGMPKTAARRSALAIEPLPYEGVTAKFELSFYAQEQDGELVFGAEYDADLFDAATIGRLFAQWQRLLPQVVADPAQPLSRYVLPSADEQKIIVQDWSRGAAAEVPAGCVHERFERQARVTPAAPALTFDGRTLSFAALNTRANRLAHALRSQGVGPDVLVGLCAQRSLDLGVAILAVWKAGGAYVALDPAQPSARLAAMLEDSAAVLLLGDAEAVAPFAGQVTTLSLESIDSLPLREDNLVSGVTASHLAYVIYTSGSTGQPKGVLIEHRQAMNLAMSLQAALSDIGVAHDGRWAWNASFGFDASLQALLAWGHGMHLHLLSADTRRDPALLAAYLREHAIDVLDATPLQIESLLSCSDELPALIIGGEAIGPDLWRRIAALPRAALNVYGPTEATVDATVARIEGERPNLGRPLSNVHCYVVDAEGMPQPEGVPGELVIGGAGVGRGYLNRAALTAERFVELDIAGRRERVYRSGDLARWIDGQLDFLGRRDGQVKIRGYRIETEEIAQQLRQLPGVAAAAVIARIDGDAPASLVGYVVPAAPQDAARVDAWRLALAGVLPDYMVPTHLVTLDALPMNASGKLDRAALPAPQYSDRSPYVAPATATEQALVKIWADLFSIDPAGIGATANFFALGGHSLLLMRMISAIRQALAVELPLKALFDAADLRACAALADAARKQAEPARARLVARQRGDTPSRLSFAQERFWFMARLTGDGAPYNMPIALRIRGDFDAAIAEQALQRIVERHAPLHSIYVDHPAEGLLSRPREDRRLVLGRRDITGLPGPQQQEQIDAAMQACFGAPFDLARDLMLRGSCIRIGAQECLLLLCVPHIAADGWSFRILQREFAALYAAFAQGLPDPLAPLAVTHGDYVEWQRERALEAAAVRDLAYWEKQLHDLPAVHGLVLDRPRAEGVPRPAGWHEFAVDRALHHGLERLARDHGCTLFMVLHAVFALVLARHAASRDIVVGTPVLNRPERDLEALIGCFINTLALRVDCDPAATFAALLQHVKAVDLDAQAHQETSFDQVVERLRPARSTLHAPLFQIMFSLGLPLRGADAQRMGGLAVETVDYANAQAKFELSLFAQQGDDALSFGLEYDTSLFDAATAARLCSHLHAALHAVVADPEQTLAAIRFDDADEQKRIAQDWSRGVAADVPAGCVHERFERQARVTPAAPALTFDGHTLSFAALNARANRLARELRERGVGPDVLVGLCAQRSLDLGVAILAVWKAGGAYVALDPAQPSARLAAMLEDSAAVLLLGDAEAVAPFAAQVTTLSLESIDSLPLREDNLVSGVTASHLAYVIYTSGSTGQPKGVLIEHRQAMNLAMNLQAALADIGVAHDGRWAWNASFGFDASLQALLAWGHGMHLHLLSTDTRRDPALLAAYLREHKIDVLDATPLQIESLLLCSDELPALIIGGEAIGPDLWRRIAALPHAALNVYGPTEATVDATLARIEGERPNLGRPLSNVHCYVVDAEGALQPEGVPGELVIGGAGVGRGYLNRPALTAERFVEVDIAGRRERVYRSGDLARWIDGKLDFLGRRDGQVKIRGYRIETEEIAQQLRQLPGVAAAAVIARTDGDAPAFLVGYVVPAAPEDAENVDAWRLALAGVLPDYMVPTHLVALDALPMNASGKLDRTALPAPQHSDRSLYVAPATATEQALVTIWADLFGIDPAGIGATANFFALGGHSLLLMRMISAIRQALAVELPLKALFDAADLRACAALADAARKQEEPARARLVARQRDDAPSPLSFAQERFWFIARLTGDGAQYNMPIALRIRGDFDAAIAEQALQRIVERHAPLHSVYVDDAAEGVLSRPREDRRFVLERMDLSDSDAEERDARVRERMLANAHTPFNLAQDLMLRGTCIRLGTDECVLLLCVPHIAADGWSFLVMEKEFVAGYEAIAQGKPDPLAPLALRYGDYAAWQRERLREAVGERQLAYWERQLRDLPAVHGLVLDRPRAEGLRHRAGWHEFAVAPALYADLKQLALEQGCTLFMVLHAVFALLLSRQSGQADVVVGTPVLNRLERDLEALIGCFVNTLVLRVDCDPALTFAALLQQVKTVNLDAQANQEVTFDQVVERLRPVRSLLHAPLFQIMFSMGMPKTAARRSTLAIEPLPYEGVTAKFELSFYAQEQDGELVFGAEYDADLFDAATIDRLFAQWQRLLPQVVADPAQPLSRYVLPSADEQKIIVQDWSRGAAAEVPAGCVHERFERQARVTPAAPALTFDGRTLSFAALNARANRLARELRERGVGPDVLVGLCAQRSLDLGVAILAVWKAGGAYVALDPAQPPARLAAMMEDSAALLLLGDAAAVAPFANQVPTLSLESIDSLPLREDNLVSGVTASHLAYVIYTSGSTGQPKGVPIEHRQAMNLAMNLQAALADIGAAHDGRWAWNASFGFDASLQALLAWGHGMHLHLLSADTRRDPALLAAYLREHKIDVLDATPLQIESLLSCSDDLPALIIGGEAIGPDLWRRIAALPRAALNVYGPTETTVDATVARIEGERPNLGRPLSNVHCYVIDAEGALQPEGVPGELVIGGAGVGRGYLNRAALTAERFVELDIAGRRERVYRSGDLARWIDGKLDFLGRRDGQVKIRGYRIETEEIAQQLRQLPGVAAAAVIARTDGDAPASLVGYVVAAAPQDADRVDAWRLALAGVLPDYMVPAHLVTLDALPTNASGKLDRAALPAPQIQRAAHRAPVRAAERFIAQVWCDLLGLESIGLDDDFFALGGQSLLAARVAARLEGAFRTALPLRTFFEHATVARLVAVFDGALGAAVCDTIAQVYLDVLALDAQDVRAQLAAHDS